jgi:hypothetical protein
MNTTFLRSLREDLRIILSDGFARDLDVMNWIKVTNPQYSYQKNSTSSTFEIDGETY